ncbi:hypothetical protein CEXT_221941 [Caerostris extrusa]|uniref:Uncharacterized protein n=1 Tax=Caerostris extrusa TaxID=172846 RepID=A0AAV4Y7R7_CAEEX|nr:hypothetical protein CEXT_221941 [Caerostris extrusa]
MEQRFHTYKKFPEIKILESRKKKGRAEKATSTSDATILLFLRLHHIKRSEQRLPLKRPLMKASEVFGERKRMTLLQFLKQGIFKRIELVWVDGWMLILRVGNGKYPPGNEGRPPVQKGCKHIYPLNVGFWHGPERILSNKCITIPRPPG